MRWRIWTGAPSLQRRLSLGLAIGVTAMWLAAAVAAGLVIREELDEAYDSALQETAQRLLPLAVLDIVERSAGAGGRRVTPIGEHKEFLTYLVRDSKGRILMQSHDAVPADFPDTPAHGFRTTKTHRIYGEKAVSGTIIMEVAETLAHRREAALEAAGTLFLPLLGLIPASLFGVWWFVRVSIRPIRSFRGAIEARGEGDLSPIADGGLPAEIEPIADAVNRLMERLRRALEAERSFTANSAHELRTPIAAALAHTQRLIAVSKDEAVRERGRHIEAGLTRLSSLSEKLMQLARAEGAGLIAEAEQDLTTVLGHLVEEFRRAEPENARLRLVTNGRLVSHMDADAFAILVRNLIENALKHGEPKGMIEIEVPSDNVVRVVNGGAVVGSDELKRLRGRFERGATRAKGAGLGLAIAQAIAAGSGAVLTLSSPAAGREDGFEAVLRLPE
ncbi:ATP-binding protein [Afifella sp. YEN Y35]|uniref:ATP-binding protein n=1 Tax=Afifella sp. YEN Y35 TaxID=3388337 RepID=UPI0039E1721B